MKKDEIEEEFTQKIIKEEKVEEATEKKRKNERKRYIKSSNDDEF